MKTNKKQLEKTVRKCEEEEKELEGSVLDDKLFESNLQKIFNEVFKVFSLYQSTDNDELRNTLYREYLLSVEFAYRKKLGDKIKIGKVDLTDWEQFEFDIKENIKIATPEVLNKLNGVRKDTAEAVQDQISEVYQILKNLPPVLFTIKPIIPSRLLKKYTTNELQSLINNNQVDISRKETKSEHHLSTTIGKSLRAKYSNVTDKNIRSISTYLTKTEIEIKRTKTGIKVIFHKSR